MPRALATIERHPLTNAIAASTRERHGGRRAHPAEHDDGAGLEGRERREQGGRGPGGMAAREERAGHHGGGHGAEAERDDGRGEVVALQQQGARVGQHARPGRVGEQLAGGEPRDVGIPPCAQPPASARRRAIRRPPPDDPDRGERGEGGDEPCRAPADVRHDADDGHARDPGRRHAGDRPREHARPLLGRRPLPSGGDADRDEQADADAGDALRGGEEREARRGRAERRAGGDERRAGAQEVAQARAPRRQGEQDGGRAAREARQRPQLARRRGGHAEIAGDVGKHGREHQHRGLGHEQAEEQHGAGSGQAWHRGAADRTAANAR